MYTLYTDTHYTDLIFGQFGQFQILKNMMSSKISTFTNIFEIFKG